MIEEEVLEEILYNYNKLARPATAKEPTVIVKHGLNLIKVIECDGKTLKAETWLEMSWIDPRLQWSLDIYDIKTLSIPSDLLWTPDIVLYNNPSSHAGNAYNPRVFIFNSGSVSWFPPTTIVTNCVQSEYDIKTVFCLMTFGSWSYDEKAVDIELMYNDIELRDYQENSKWELRNSTVVRNVRKYPCCPEPYADVTYNITLRRREAVPPSSNVPNLPESLNGKIENGTDQDTNNKHLDKINGGRAYDEKNITESTTVTGIKPDGDKDSKAGE